MKGVIAVAITTLVYYGLNPLLPHHTESTAIAGADSTTTSAGGGNTEPAAVAPPISAADSSSSMADTTSPASNAAANTGATASPVNAPFAASSAAVETIGLGEDQARQIAKHVGEPSAPQVVQARHPRAAATKPVSKQPVRVSSNASQAPAYLPPPASALTAWWTPDSEVKDGQFTLVYAGSAAFEKAIVLLFSNPVGDASSTGQSIQYDGCRRQSRQRSPEN